MRKVGLIAAFLLLAVSHYGYGKKAVIAGGGNFVLTPDDLRSEVYNLGPSYTFKDTYQDRKALVDVLSTRFFLTEEALERGYGEEGLADEVKSAEAAAVGEAYRKWKIEKAVRVPRVESKPVLEELDRTLHLKQMVFAVYPIAEQALREIKAGKAFESMATSLAGREDVRVIDEGWKVWKNFDRSVANEVFQLHVGAVTGILRGKQGYSIYYLVEDARAGATQELIYMRSKRFVRAIKEADLIRKEREELSRGYHVRFSDDGLGAALRAFAIAFEGDRPPDSLLACVLASHDLGGVTAAQMFTYYYTLPATSQPYVGDFNAIKEFTLDTILPELEAAAGYSLNLDRLREVLWSVKKAKEEFLIPKMEEFFGNQITLSPDDPITYFNEHRSEMVTPKIYKARRILVDSEEAAQEAMKELRSGKEFAQVAVERSLDKYSAKKGGDLGYLEYGIITAYDSIVVDLKPGEISRPFTTGDGVEIVKVEDMSEARALTFEEAKSFIEGTIVTSRGNKLLADWVGARKSGVGYTVDEALLKEVELPQPAWKAGLVKESRPEREAEGGRQAY